MKIFYYIRRFWEIPGEERRLLFIGLMVFILVKIAIFILPYRSILTFIVVKTDSKYHNRFVDLNKISLCRKMIRRLEFLFPLKMNCVIKAIVLKFMLREFGMSSDISLSIKKDNLNLTNAHAYLSLNESIHFYRIPGYIDVQSNA
jgi:hypothetical protein